MAPVVVLVGVIRILVIVMMVTVMLGLKTTPIHPDIVPQIVFLRVNVVILHMIKQVMAKTVVVLAPVKRGN
jgi:hypothetical protein